LPYVHQPRKIAHFHLGFAPPFVNRHPFRRFFRSPLLQLPSLSHELELNQMMVKRSFGGVVFLVVIGLGEMFLQELFGLLASMFLFLLHLLFFFLLLSYLPCQRRCRVEMQLSLEQRVLWWLLCVQRPHPLLQQHYQQVFAPRLQLQPVSRQ